MRILVAENRFVFWATDSMSLPRRMRESEATAVQAALESMYAGAIVKRLETLSDAAHPA